MKRITQIKKGSFFTTYKEGVCFVFDHIGSFFVSRNSQVSFQLEQDGLDEDVLKGYLNGAVLAAQLTFKGNYVVHGGLVELGDKLIGIIGDSGIGKSTVLHGLYQDLNATIYSDDLIAFEKDGTDFFLTQTNFCGLRLWEESVDAFSLDVNKFKKVHPLYDKVNVPIDHKSLKRKNIDALVVLDYEKEFSIYKLNQSEAFRHVLGHLKCKEYLPEQLEASHFEFASSMAKEIPTYVLKRKMGIEYLKDSIALIADVCR